MASKGGVYYLLTCSSMEMETMYEVKEGWTKTAIRRRSGRATVSYQTRGTPSLIFMKCASMITLLRDWQDYNMCDRPGEHWYSRESEKTRAREFEQDIRKCSKDPDIYVLTACSASYAGYASHKYKNQHQ